MKNVIGFLSIALICASINTNAYASTRCDENWKEKMMSEKIAFLTMEVGLTPEEAQIFWPVYNQVEKEKDEAMMNIMNTYRALNKATEEGKTGAELSNLLDKYLEALEKVSEIDNGSAEKYKAVLPTEKVAKLYVAEEKFRRHHIRSMKNNHQKSENKRPDNR